MSVPPDIDLANLGARRVLLKGGHLIGGDATDLWLDADGEHMFTEPRVPTANTHGTGCSLSSAMAALRAADSLEIGQGPGPVHHFYDLWKAP